MREVPGPAIVVGVDGSKAALHAAVWAVDEAISREIPLRLVYIIDPLHPVGAGGHDAGHDGPQAAACTALRDARQAAVSAGETVKVETEILWGRPLTKLMEESRYAAMVCIGSIGLNHACRGGGSVAAALATSALCPVAVINRPAGGPAGQPVSGIAVGVDNGVVLRHAFEEARLRGVPVQFLSGNGSGPTQLGRRLARWTRLYPDVQVETGTHIGRNQLFVVDAHECRDVCGTPAGFSVLAIRCGNL
jgi:nucleotide-binding universal stress UspA family protein